MTVKKLERRRQIKDKFNLWMYSQFKGFLPPEDVREDSCNLLES